MARADLAHTEGAQRACGAHGALRKAVRARYAWLAHPIAFIRGGGTNSAKAGPVVAALPCRALRACRYVPQAVSTNATIHTSSRGVTCSVCSNPAGDAR